MTGIKITKANIGKINEFIKLAEGRATVRQIDANLILKTADKITKVLNIPKKDMIGIIVSADPNAQKFPRAYKYTPESTHFTMDYRSGGWYLTSAGRYETSAQTKAYKVHLTDAAKNAIIARHQTLGIYDI